MHVSTATRPGRFDRDNEDFVAASHNTVVLLDGAGTPPGSESGCLHGVAWYARNLGTELLKRATENRRSSLREVLSESIDRVASLHRDTCDLAHPGTPSATVIVIRETGADLEYLVLADSVLILQGQDEIVAITDDREAQVGLSHRALMDSLPAGSPEHTRAHRAYVEALRKYRNRAGGFWVASIDPAASQEALVGARSLDTLDSVLLLSDGASRLVDRFAIATWSDLVDLSRSKGPDSLLDWVREAEASDPAGERWPRGKSSDDATVACIAELGPRLD